MIEISRYNLIKGSQVIIEQDDCDYEVKLHGAVIANTSDEFEASLIAEAVDVALSILSAQNLLTFKP